MYRSKLSVGERQESVPLKSHRCCSPSNPSVRLCHVCREGQKGRDRRKRPELGREKEGRKRRDTKKTRKEKRGIELGQEPEICRLVALRFEAENKPNQISGRSPGLPATLQMKVRKFWRKAIFRIEKRILFFLKTTWLRRRAIIFAFSQLTCFVETFGLEHLREGGRRESNEKKRKQRARERGKKEVRERGHTPAASLAMDT